MRCADAVARLAAGLLLLLLAPGLAAAQGPVGDPRLASLIYDSGRIYPIEVASGYTLMIALGNGERVETMAVGDSNAWQVTTNKRGDAIFIKRIKMGVNSNLTVVTDARTYVFELLGYNPGYPPPFVINFTYPQPDRSQAAAAAVETNAYRVRGTRALRPSMIAVKGNLTELVWPPDVAVPAVFQIDDDGVESLVNGMFQDDRMIIQGVPRRLLFRAGARTATATRIGGGRTSR
jgi:type IV secretion system protein VirB9